MAYRWFLFRAKPLRDEAGQVTKWFGTNTDIDQRKRAEDAFRVVPNSRTQEPLDSQVHFRVDTRGR